MTMEMSTALAKFIGTVDAIAEFEGNVVVDDVKPPNWSRESRHELSKRLTASLSHAITELKGVWDREHARDGRKDLPHDGGQNRSAD